MRKMKIPSFLLGVTITVASFGLYFSLKTSADLNVSEGEVGLKEALAMNNNEVFDCIAILDDASGKRMFTELRVFNYSDDVIIARDRGGKIKSGKYTLKNTINTSIKAKVVLIE